MFEGSVSIVCVSPFPLTPRTGRDPGPDSLPRSLIEGAVAQVFAVDRGHLRGASRGKAPVALARQVAMYLAHVAMGFSLTEVGYIFCRDRTTVAHACAVIEDRRDDQTFDRVLDCLERVVRHLLAPRAPVVWQGCFNG